MNFESKIHDDSGKGRKICVVVTARPSYSRVKTLLSAIDKRPGLELQLVVAASALLDRYGSAIDYIEEDGFEVAARVFNVLEGENLTAAAKTTGIGILELSTVFDNLNPDIVVTIADRFETMATAVSAAFMNIPLAHIQGGEVTGNIDEKVRHSISKLADYHFVSSESARERLLRLGENPANVYNTGCPSVDLAAEVSQSPKLNFDPYKKYGGVGSQPDLSQGYLVVMQHPVTNEYEDSRRQVLETLQAVDETGLPTLWFWPNVDAGSDGTSNGIRSFRELVKPERMHFFKGMKPEDFLRLLLGAGCLVGNSSAGIRECAFLGVPVVNIGTRQQGRDRGMNILDVNYNKAEILNAIKTWLKAARPQTSDVYGGGKAGESIAELLEKVELKYHKRITY